jgi:hypothetical protein
VQPDFLFPDHPGGQPPQSSPFLHRFGGFVLSGFALSLTAFGSFGCRQNRRMFLFSCFGGLACGSDFSTERFFRGSLVARSFTGRGGRLARDDGVPDDALGAPTLLLLSRSRTLRSPVVRDVSASERDDDRPSLE